MYRQGPRSRVVAEEGNYRLQNAKLFLLRTGKGDSLYKQTYYYKKSMDKKKGIITPLEHRKGRQVA